MQRGFVGCQSAVLFFLYVDIFGLHPKLRFPSPVSSGAHGGRARALTNVLSSIFAELYSSPSFPLSTLRLTARSAAFHNG